MIKIVALNEESEEGSGSEEEEVTREALEQIALVQYSKALELQRRGGEATEDALRLLKDLLDTELLYDIKKPESGEKVTEPLFNLKYLCFKNVANIHSNLGQKEEAIEAYCQAAALDDTDVTLWHRLGTLCLQCHKFDMALEAFQKGFDCNSKHWPCVDKIITLLLGLGHYNDCIIAIFDALKLDPDYLRGLVYRRHIYTEFPYILDYMSYLNPIYAWKRETEEELDEKRAEILLKEAEDISIKFAEQIKENTFNYTLPELKLVKPVTSLTWTNLGQSLVHMHKYMTEHCYTHASKLELVFQKEVVEEKMDISIEQQKSDSNELKVDEITEIEKNGERNVENCGSENENNESDKATDNDKAESDPDNAPQASEIKLDGKEQKKQPVRRRASDLRFLEQWEWCTRRSSRKKTATKQERADETIFDTLRRLIPISLTPEVIQKKREKPERLDDSPDTMDLYRLFEEKQESNDGKKKNVNDSNYFGSTLEQSDVDAFINRFNNTRSDIIQILREYLTILADKWRLKWPDGLPSVFIEANKCCSSHFDTPSYTEENYEDLRFFVLVNLTAEEITINDKLRSELEKKETYDCGVVEALGYLVNKPQIFIEDCMEITLRHLWLKCYCHLYNNQDEFALDCLYQLLCEFEGMGEHEETYTLGVINFTLKPVISKAEAASLIKFLERNKRLSTVMGLYDQGNLEEVLSIITDSFDHCKTIARKQEYDEMSLDFAVQLSLILDCYWGLGKPDLCFKWSATCLHESLKHYLLSTPNSQEYDKWALVVIKALVCMEYCLKTEGGSYLDALSEEELSQVIEDIIQVIGHQIDDNNGSDMPLNTVAPWVILHYILQREEDQGRCKKTEVDKMSNITSDEVPNPLMVLFVAHENLGKKGWCCNQEGQLLYFILDTVIPRLRTPALSRSVEQICQYLEQCVFCLFGHPSKKTRLRYLVDHNVTPHRLDWERAQQLYEVFKPVDLPEIEGKLPCITAETEQLLQRMVSLLPVELEPKKHLPELIKYIELKTDVFPSIPVLLPYKMKDIFYILGDYYFKKDERSKSTKYNLYDIVVNNDRFESWAEIALAKATNLEVKLNSCSNVKDMDIINESSVAIRCFKRALELDSMHCNMWIEYGVFVYYLHSFCSRLLKQASESLSMEDFGALEQRKQEMLDTAEKSFTIVSQDLNSSDVQDAENDERWLLYYMLGKIAEKRNRPPKEYLDHYMQAAKHLQDNNATYPAKINYNNPQNLSIEALEVHYRIHASILKYMEQHENKVILAVDGRVFHECLENCANGPFSTKKKNKKDPSEDNEASITKPSETVQSQIQQPQPASSVLKRSISDSGEETGVEAKKQKLENAAKVRRAASYDADCQALKDSLDPRDSGLDVLFKAAMIHSQEGNVFESEETPKICNATDIIDENAPAVEPTGPIADGKDGSKTDNQHDTEKPPASLKKDETTSNSDSSSSSTSESSSEDSSSSSSSSSSAESNATSKSSNDTKPLSEVEIMQIISPCLDALEDCVSRFPQHYKALYRLAHYHFYYKKGKDIERCRDLMLSSFVGRNNQKMPGLFSERKNNNFFNAIWRIPTTEVDRAGSFACHMSRCVLLSMEILKEIDDHKTLLDLSMQLSRIPEPDKKYLRDSERDELAQQAFSLCVQSLKGQLTKFGQQADLKTNEMERQALNSLMLDIYRAYQKAQKQPNSKQFTNLLVEGYKLASLTPVNENANLVDLSMRFCQSLIASLKQQATMASIAQSGAASNAKKNMAKSFDSAKSQPQPSLPKPDAKAAPTVPMMSPQDISAAFQNYLPLLNDPLLSQQTAAALSLSYINNFNTLAGYTSLQNSLQNTLQNTFQSEFYKQFLASSLNTNYGMPVQKKTQGNRGKKNYNKLAVQATNSAGKIQKPKNTSKSFTGTALPPSSIIKSIAPLQTGSTTITSVPKSMSAPCSSSFSISSILPPMSAPLVSSMSSFGTTMQPAHMTSTSLTSYTSTSSGTAKPAHMTTTSTVNAALHTKPPMPHQQVSPGKTLQEKLAERQKNMPNVPPERPKNIPNVQPERQINTANVLPERPKNIPNVQTERQKNMPNASSERPKNIPNVPPERQKNMPNVPPDRPKNMANVPPERQRNTTMTQELSSSISKLPSSLTVTKTNVNKPQNVQGKKEVPKKPEGKRLQFEKEQLAMPKNPISSSEIIVLDDDD